METHAIRTDTVDTTSSPSSRPRLDATTPAPELPPRMPHPHLAEPRLPTLLVDSADGMAAISFDVFDTLLTRPLADPEDAFDMLGASFGIPDFRARRKEAQVRAFARMREAGAREITLDGIYACFDALPVPAATLKQAEYELELALTLPNPEVVSLFRSLVARNKTVVLTSDMYMPAAFFAELLRRHDLPAVPMFVSSDRNCTKRDAGELFGLVAAELGLPPNRILHIGDNPVGDVLRASEAGFQVFHYVSSRVARPPTRSSPSASIASAVAKIHEKDIVAGTFYELGFHYGGPAAVGFLHWLEQRALADGIDLLLFVSRDGYMLQRLAAQGEAGRLPPYLYFMGSRTAFTLAAMNEGNFDAHLDFLLSGVHGLSPADLFDRIGVMPPSDAVLADLGFAPDLVISDATLPAMRTLMSACRAAILQVCRRNRRGLFRYLQGLGIRSGMRIGLVDVGWNGTTQEAFERAIRDLVPVEVMGYYFCLTDTPDCLRRQERMAMQAMISSRTLPHAVVADVYANRVAAELFFSAPHHAVIGYDSDVAGHVAFVEDQGRGDVTDTRQASDDMTAGALEFATRFHTICRDADFVPWPLDTVTPFLDLVTVRDRDLSLINEISNFDAWGSTAGKVMRVRDYLP